MSSAAVDIPRCTAHTGAGRQCKKLPINGGTVCATHGGRAPQVRAAADRRVARAEAEVLVARLLHSPDAEPVTDPVSVLARTVGRIEHAAQVLGERVNLLPSIDYADKLGVRRLHVEFEAWRDLTFELRRALTDMTRLGLNREALRLMAEQPSREQAEMLSQVIAKVLADPRVTVEPGAANAVVLEALKGLGA